uniref:hypothetical protein n=1 Tax=Porphyromonas macacae TaxID=28115 RepID=UPI0035A04503
GRVEKFDFEYAEKIHKETGWNAVECDGWYIKLHSGGWPSIQEYAPADDNVYYILKNFYPNGMIHNRGKQLGFLKFGLWEHFNRHGKLVKVVDEDAKFGEVKWYDVAALLEKEGWFNRQTGEINIRDSWAQQGPTIPNGKFTYKINRLIHFVFFPAEKKNGREVKPPIWRVEIYENQIVTETIYEINGHTGEFTKKVVVKMLIR